MNFGFVIDEQKKQKDFYRVCCRELCEESDESVAELRQFFYEHGSRQGVCFHTLPPRNNRPNV